MARPTRYHDQLREQKRRHFLRKVLFILLLALAGCAGLVYGLFFTSLFEIREVQIHGVTTVSADSLKSDIDHHLDTRVLGIKKRNNILFLSSTKLAQVLQHDNPKLESTAIHKTYFHKLEATVKERTSTGIWCLSQQNQCFYFDKSNVLYDNAPATSGFLIFNVQDQRSRQLELGDKAENSEWTTSLVSAWQHLMEQHLQIKTLIIPDGSFDEFDAIVSRPGDEWKILLSINTDLPQQIKSLSDFLTQKLPPDRVSQLQYADLRIQDRIYYK